MRGINHADDWSWANAPRFGSESTPSTTTSTSAPWSGQQPYLSGLFSQAQNLATNYQPQYFGGDTYAPLTDLQKGVAGKIAGTGLLGGSTALQTANNSVTGMQLPGYTADTNTAFQSANPQIAQIAGGSALSGTQGAFGQGQNYLSNMLSGATLDPNSAPGFQSLVNSTLADVLPTTNASFIKGGRSDSGLAQRAATSAATDAVGKLGLNYYLGQQQLQDSAAKQAAANQATGLNATLGAGGLASSNLLTQQGNQIKASGIAPLLDQQQMADMTAGLNASGLSQQDQQNQINAAIQRFNFNQMAPWNTAGMFQGLINGNYGSQGTTTTPYYSNTAANVLGLGTGLLGLNQLTGSAGGGFGSTLLGGLGSSLYKSIFG